MKRREPSWIKELSERFSHKECNEWCKIPCQVCGKPYCKHLMIDGECALCFSKPILDPMDAGKERRMERLERLMDEETRLADFNSDRD